MQLYRRCAGKIKEAWLTFPNSTAKHTGFCDEDVSSNPTAQAGIPGTLYAGYGRIRNSEQSGKDALGVQVYPFLLFSRISPLGRRAFQMCRLTWPKTTKVSQVW